MNLKKSEIVAYIVLFIHIIIGVVISRVDIVKYERGYVLEDGYIEWLTVVALLAGAFVCFRRVFQLRSVKPKWFLFCLCILGSLYIFGAGEEISWGQRLFGLEPGEFFRENNAQSEMNLHNLVVDGKKINKIVFGLGLGIFVVFYLLILPVIFEKQEKLKKLINSFAIPVPRLHHVLAYIALAILASFIPGGKKGEIMEFGGCWIFFFITLNPVNILLYRLKSSV